MPKAMFKAIATINAIKGCSRYVSRPYVVSKNETKRLLSQATISAPAVIVLLHSVLSRIVFRVQFRMLR